MKWLPNSNKAISGEVKSPYILLYDENIETALETLRHEFLDHVLSKIVESYKEVTNRLIALVNDDACRRKERLVEALSRIIA